jgi:hypothetical protein
VDGIFDLDNFEKFVLEKYKVGGKPGNLTSTDYAGGDAERKSIEGQH